MAESDAFLQAIAANPDDDGPRLVLADWLEERGDVRGEFIRVQCRLARHERGERLKGHQLWPLQERQDDLLRRHRDRWLGPWRWAGRAELVRGLVQLHVHDGAAFVRAAADPGAAAAGAWVQELVWGNAPGEPGACAAATAALPYVSVLRLGGHFEPHPAALAVAAAPWKALARAELSFESPYWDGWGWTHRLSRPEPSSGLQSAALVGLLTRSGALAHLTALKLTGYGLDATPTARLLRGLAGPRLTALDLSHNPLGDAGAEAVASAPELADVTELVLTHCNIGRTGAIALAAAPHLGRVRRLVISEGNALGARGLRALHRRFGLGLR